MYDQEAILAESESNSWPEEYGRLAREWRQAKAQGDGAGILGELWMLTNAALAKYLRIHASRLGWVGEEDIFDIASEKSLDLIQKIDASLWEPGQRTAGEICSFLSRVARNGLIEHLRCRQRAPKAVGNDWELEAPEIAEPLDPSVPEDDIDRHRFAHALRDCAMQLRPRPRAVWLLRLLYDMRSKEIANHPRVCTSVAAVDMILVRCRRRMQSCMRSKGYDLRELPTGTFTALWHAFQGQFAPPRRRGDR